MHRIIWWQLRLICYFLNSQNSSRYWCRAELWFTNWYKVCVSLHSSYRLSARQFQVGFPTTPILASVIYTLKTVPKQCFWFVQYFDSYLSWRSYLHVSQALVCVSKAHPGGDHVEFNAASINQVLLVLDYRHRRTNSESCQKFPTGNCGLGLIIPILDCHRALYGVVPPIVWSCVIGNSLLRHIFEGTDYQISLKMKFAIVKMPSTKQILNKGLIYVVRYLVW